MMCSRPGVPIMVKNSRVVVEPETALLRLALDEAGDAPVSTMRKKYHGLMRVVGELAASIVAVYRVRLSHCRRGTTMQWIGETIDAPITGDLDTDPDQVPLPFGRDLLHVLQSMQQGDFSVRMAAGPDGLCGQIAEAVNRIASANQRIAQELAGVGEEVGREGRTGRRADLGLPGRDWGEIEDQLNRLIDDLLWPTTAITRAVAAVGRGDLTKTVALDIDGRPLKGDFLQAATAVNATIRQLGTFAAETIRIARDVGAEGARAAPRAGDAAGVWQVMTQSVSAMAQSVTARAGNADVTELERQIAEGAAELARSESRLQDSEDGRILALAAGRMGSWDWDLVSGLCHWDAGQRQIFGTDPTSHQVALPVVRGLVDNSDWKMLCRQLKRARQRGGAWQLEFRARRPDGSVRWCLGTAVAARDATGRIVRIRGITMDITERKEAEDRQSLLAREVDHRTKNALAVVHAIVSLTRADDIQEFSTAVEGRIQALARAHSLLSDSRWHGAKIADLVQGELAALRRAPCERIRMSGRSMTLHPSAVLALALALHELAANAARHGALSVASGSLEVAWEQRGDELALQWSEYGGPCPPSPVGESQVGGSQAGESQAGESQAGESQVGESQIREGLGLRIVRASVETQLCGRIAFDWRAEGLVCIIHVPCQSQPEVFGNFLYSIQNPGAWRRTTALR
jgi:two-component sensor histidine kinase/PAS domain-containing protein